MKPNTITEKLKQLRASDRFDILYGPERKNIEEILGCKIRTLPLEQLGFLNDEKMYFMVTDSNQGLSYLAVLEPTK